VVTFSPFRAGKSRRHAKKKRRVLLFTVATASPRQNKTKIYKREGSNNEERARDEISDGGRNFGRETKTRRSKPGKHELPVKAFRQGRARLPPTDSALAPRGLHGTGGAIARIRPEPVHAKIECAIAHHCMASPQQMQEKTLRRESQGGAEIVRGGGGDAAVPKRPLRLGMRPRAVRTRPERAR
jgi:hypothetical protein